MDSKIQKFTSKFQFQGNVGTGLVGCEREFFIHTMRGQLVPVAPILYPHLEELGCGYELSACQLEMRVGPDSLNTFCQSINRMRIQVESKCLEYRFKPCYESIAPDDMSLKVYPDPTGRYESIAKSMPTDKLLAACRITGTHIHIGMPDIETALKVHDNLVEHTGELIRIGDLTNGERIRIYKIVTPNYLPMRLLNVTNMVDMYEKENCIDDPRSWWKLIRISKHGTIEFRMFDNTDDDQQVLLWGKTCHELCMGYM